MGFSDIFTYEKHLKELNEYRNDYIDYLEKKYANADGPNYLIDMSTLEVLENEGESELMIPRFGYLNEYYCKPAQDLIKEAKKQLLREYPEQESPVKQKKLSKYAQDLRKETRGKLLHEYPEQESPVKQKKLSKYDDEKMTHVSAKSRLEKICSKLERRQNMTVDTGLQYPYKKCKKTKKVCSSSEFRYQNLPIDDLSISFKECKGNKTEPRQKINQNPSKSTVSYEESKCETYFNCEGNMSSNSHTIKEVSEVENSCSFKYKAKGALHHTTYHNKIIKCNSEKRVTVKHKSLLIEFEQTEERYNKVRASSMLLTDLGFSKEKQENELDLSLETKSQEVENVHNGTLSSLIYHRNLGHASKCKKLDSENKLIISKDLTHARVMLNRIDFNW